MPFFERSRTSFLAVVAVGCLPLPSSAPPSPAQKPAPTPVQLDSPRTPPVSVAPSVPRTEGEYHAPSDAVRELLTTPSPPIATVHSEAGWLMLEHRTALVPLERLARPQLQLAALHIDKDTYSSPSETRITKIELLALRETGDDGNQRRHTIIPPDGTELSAPLVSPDGRYFSAVALSEDSSDLVVYSLEEQRWAKSEGPIQLAFGSPCAWTVQGRLFCVFVPDGRGPVPAPVYGPSILEHFGGPVPIRMRTDLLSGVKDEALFDYFFAGELRVVDPERAFIATAQEHAATASEEQAPPPVEQGQSPETQDAPVVLAEDEPEETLATLSPTVVGPAGIISAFAVSPDGKYVHVTTLERPYSHITGWEYFPRSETLWDVDKGRAILTLLLRKGSELTFLGPPLGRRATRWHPFEPATMTWLERSEKAGVTTDRWLAQAMPPYSHPVRTLKTSSEIVDRGFSTAGTPWTILKGGKWGSLKDAHRELRPGFECGPGERAVVDALRSSDRPDLILESGGKLLVSSDRIIEEGRPILDSVDVATGARTTLFKSAPDHYERVIWVIDDHTWLTVREANNVAPHYLLHKKGQTARFLTEPANPYPALKQVDRRLVRYMRDDGLELSAQLYLPPGYLPGRRVSTVIWIYPTEHTEASYANQSAEALRHRFADVSGPSRLSLVLAGYALLDNPSMPIIGADGQANDNYLSHLEMSAEAAVRFLVQEGISSPGRIAVAGRSYGAFSAVNLLAHTDLFATAIALSGAYNRTLTPFGYQNERRTFWTQTELYARVSPFFAAQEIDEPLLLIHGQIDENTGTPLLQSERMFHAVVGIGGQARLVVLPLEGHQFRGEESVLHTAYEMISWLDRHLAPPSSPTTNPGPKTRPRP